MKPPDNQPATAAQLPRPAVCQLTSRHSLMDERILHRMAWTAARSGFRSLIVGPHERDETCGQVELVACPRMSPADAANKRVAIPLQIFRWALHSRHRLFQIHDPDLLPVAVGLRAAGRRVIYDVHEDYEADVRMHFPGCGIVARLGPLTWWALERSAASACNAIVAADRHVASKFPGRRTVVLGNFPRLDFTRPADTSREQTFNIIYVGGVCLERGLGVALDALALLPQPDIRFHVLGNCSDKQLDARLRADRRVVCHGFVPWTELHLHYEKAHLGLALYQPVPNFLYSPGENAVKINEYMAAGIPTLCSNFPGLKSFVETAGCGVTVPPCEVPAIAREIENFYVDRERGGRLGRTARQLFEQDHNWEKHEPALAAVYRKLLSEFEAS